MRKLNKRGSKPTGRQKDWGCTHTKHGCLVPTPKCVCPIFPLPRCPVLILLFTCRPKYTSLCFNISTSLQRAQWGSWFYAFCSLIGSGDTLASHMRYRFAIYITQWFSQGQSLSLRKLSNTNHTTCVPCLGLTERGSCLQLDQSTVHSCAHTNHITVRSRTGFGD